MLSYELTYKNCSIQKERHIGKTGFWTHCLEAWTLDTWNPDDWLLGFWMPGHLDSERFYCGRLEARTLDDWKLGLWTLGARKFFPFLVSSLSFLLFNV